MTNVTIIFYKEPLSWYIIWHTDSECNHAQFRNAMIQENVAVYLKYFIHLSQIAVENISINPNFVISRTTMPLRKGAVTSDELTPAMG